MIGIELNFITKEGQNVDNERYLDDDMIRPNRLELRSWLSSGNTLRINVNEYLPEDDDWSFNDCLREYTIKNYLELKEFNKNIYKIL